MQLKPLASKKWILSLNPTPNRAFHSSYMQNQQDQEHSLIFITLGVLIAHAALLAWSVLATDFSPKQIKKPQNERLVVKTISLNEKKPIKKKPTALPISREILEEQVAMGEKNSQSPSSTPKLEIVPLNAKPNLELEPIPKINQQLEPSNEESIKPVVDPIEKLVAEPISEPVRTPEPQPLPNPEPKPSPKPEPRTPPPTEIAPEQSPKPTKTTKPKETAEKKVVAPSPEKPKPKAAKTPTQTKKPAQVQPKKKPAQGKPVKKAEPPKKKSEDKTKKNPPSPPAPPVPPAPSAKEKEIAREAAAREAAKIAAKEAEKVKQREAVKAKQRALLQSAQENIAKIEQTRDKIKQAKAGSSSGVTNPRTIGTLQIDARFNDDGGELTYQEKGYHEELATRLKLLLRLPDYGEVKVKLTLDRSGRFSNVIILSSESDKNRKYIEKTLPALTYPGFGKNFGDLPQHTFVIILSNEV